MILKYGSRKKPVGGLTEAMSIWNDIRDLAMSEGLGNSDMPHTPEIYDDNGKYLGHLSWNGRAWRPDTSLAASAANTYKGIPHREWLPQLTVS